MTEPPAVASPDAAVSSEFAELASGEQIARASVNLSSAGVGEFLAADAAAEQPDARHPGCHGGGRLRCACLRYVPRGARTRHPGYRAINHGRRRGRPSARRYADGHFPTPSGRARFFVSGGAPLGVDTAKWFASGVAQSISQTVS